MLRFHKKGIQAETLVIMIVAALSIVIVFGVFYQIQAGEKESRFVDKNACKLNVARTATLKNMPGVEILYDIGYLKSEITNCKEYNVKITHDDIKEDNLKKKIANTMYDCWDMWGEGEVEVFTWADTEFVTDKNVCHVCSVINGAEPGFFEKYFSGTPKLEPDDRIILDRINNYNSYIEKASKDYGVRSTLIKAMIYKESSGDYKAVSDCGAAGLTQLMPGIAKDYNLKVFENSDITSCTSTEESRKIALEYSNRLKEKLSDPNLKNIDERFDPEKSIMTGTNYLKDLINKNKGDEAKALGDYYGMSGSYVRFILNKENLIKEVEEPLNYKKLIIPKDDFYKFLNTESIPVKGTNYYSYFFKGKNNEIILPAGDINLNEGKNYAVVYLKNKEAKIPIGSAISAVGPYNFIGLSLTNPISGLFPNGDLYANLLYSSIDPDKPVEPGESDILVLLPLEDVHKLNCEYV